jgi:hypothetical protein
MDYGQQSSRRDLEAYTLMLRVVYFALLATVAMYWFVQELVAANRESAELGLLPAVFLVGGASTVMVVLVLRFSVIPPLLSAATTGLAPRLARLRMYYILCFALAEAVALYGFVLRILGGNREDTIPFYVAAIVLLALCYPRTPQTTAGGPIG